MQTHLLWQGLLHQSLEHCVVARSTAGTEVSGVIVGLFDNTICRVEYSINTNTDWETHYFAIKAQLADRAIHFTGERDTPGSWLIEGIRAEELDGCIDIDISLTPFTNTLPINRLKLSQKESRMIDVVYIDVLEQAISRKQQRYTRISDEAYRYENMPNDFEAVISVDGEGLVADYPGLFVRTATMIHKYQNG